MDEIDRVADHDDELRPWVEPVDRSHGLGAVEVGDRAVEKHPVIGGQVRKEAPGIDRCYRLGAALPIRAREEVRLLRLGGADLTISAQGREERGGSAAWCPNEEHARAREVAPGRRASRELQALQAIPFAGL